jgi:hypothetical protein
MTSETDIEKVLEAEREHIGLPGASESSSAPRYTGLALSGGGIRSASFCLGVLQALVAGGILPKIDYLSTVSGGGYIGASLTWFLSRPPGEPATARPPRTPVRAPEWVRVPRACRRRQPHPRLRRQHGNYPFLIWAQHCRRWACCPRIGVSPIVYFAILCGAVTLLHDAGFFLRLTDRLPAIPIVWRLFAVFLAVWTLH